jgi:hypothetical protein
MTELTIPQYIGAIVAIIIALFLISVFFRTIFDSIFECYFKNKGNFEAARIARLSALYDYLFTQHPELKNKQKEKSTCQDRTKQKQP